MKHLEYHGNLAKIFGEINNSDLLMLTDLLHDARVVIDIDLNSPVCRDYLLVGDECGILSDRTRKERQIRLQAKELLSHLEEVDGDGVAYYTDESAKRLHNLIDEYESN